MFGNCSICKRVLLPHQDLIRIRNDERIKEPKVYHINCFNSGYYKSRVRKVILMSKDSEIKVFTRKDGKSAGILRFKTKIPETEPEAIVRLDEKGWNASAAPKHVVDTPHGKVFHYGTKDTCKYCRKGEVSAKDTAPEPAKSDPPKKKRGRPPKKEVKQ